MTCKTRLWLKGNRSALYYYTSFTARLPTQIFSLPSTIARLYGLKSVYLFQTPHGQP